MQSQLLMLNSFWRSLHAVTWAFFGVRKSKDHDKDIKTIKPMHAILAGIFLATFFVVSLIALVNIITAV